MRAVCRVLSLVVLCGSFYTLPVQAGPTCNIVCSTMNAACYADHGLLPAVCTTGGPPTGNAVCLGLFHAPTNFIDACEAANCFVVQAGYYVYCTSILPES